jgi:hypothetical protein
MRRPMAKRCPVAKCLVAAAVLVCGGMTAPALADRALIVGIDVYQEASLTFALGGASKADSERIHKLLTGSLGYREEDIKILRDSEATRAAILENLDVWLGEAKPGERVFFYYVGHGHFTKDVSGDEGDGLDETLVPFDAAVDRGGVSVVVQNVVLDDELASAFDKLRGRQVTAVIDSCHSGTVTRSIQGPPRNLAARTPQLRELTRSIRVDPSVDDQKQSGPAPDGTEPEIDIVTWTAVAPTQLALINEEAAPNYHGLFTAAFADGIEKGLADGNKNGIISNQELLDYVRGQSEAYCKRNAARCEMGVTPSLDGAGAALKVAATIAATDTPLAEDASPPAEEAKPGAPINTGKVTPDKILDILGASLATDVILEQIPHSPVPLGTKNIRFRVTSPRDGYLVLLSVSDEGEVVQLFPNSFSEKHAKDGRIRAGSTVTIPDPSYGMRFDATSVTKGTVLALVAVDPLKLSKSFLTRKIEVIPQEEVNSKVLPELAQSLATPASAGSIEVNVKAVGRSVATLPYEITP